MGKSVKLTTSAKKTVGYNQREMRPFELLAKSQTQTEKVDLRKLTEYPLTPVPYRFGLHIADCFLAKTDRSRALLHIFKDIDDRLLSTQGIA